MPTGIDPNSSTNRDVYLLYLSQRAVNAQAQAFPREFAKISHAYTIAAEHPVPCTKHSIPEGLGSTPPCQSDAIKVPVMVNMTSFTLL